MKIKTIIVDECDMIEAFKLRININKLFFKPVHFTKHIFLLVQGLTVLDQYELSTDRNTRDHLAWTVENTRVYMCAYSTTHIYTSVLFIRMHTHIRAK